MSAFLAMNPNPNPNSFYVRALRAHLPEAAFAPQPGRLLWFALHCGLIVSSMALIISGVGGWPLALLLSLVIGHSFTGVAFVGHETLHGSVVRGRGVTYVVGWFCLLPFVISPRLWKAWHNKVHHGNTMMAGVDPDAYPTIEEYQSSKSRQFADRFAVARGHWLSVLCFALGFNLQSLQILIGARKNEYLSPREHRWAIAETLLGVSVWMGLGFLVGPTHFLFVFVLPMMVANAVAMSYILTNHHLSPLTEVNDPLLNSLTVTVPRFWDALHSSFGLHVEHHVFPAISSAHLPEVRRLLQEKFPERYQSMPLHRAVWQLMRTPRVYKTPTLLVDPRTGFEASALLPRT